MNLDNRMVKPAGLEKPLQDGCKKVEKTGKIKALRLQHNLSQFKAAEYLEVSETVLAKWDQGKTEPGLEARRKILELAAKGRTPRDMFVEGFQDLLRSSRAGPGDCDTSDKKGPGHSEETTRPLQDKEFSEPPNPPFSPMAELLELETLFLERLRSVSSDPVRTEKAIRSLYSKASARANSWHLYQFMGGKLDEGEAAKVGAIMERWSELADEAIHLSYQPFCYDRDNARRLRTITATDESQAKFIEAVYRALPEADWRNK